MCRQGLFACVCALLIAGCGSEAPGTSRSGSGHGVAGTGPADNPKPLQGGAPGVSPPSNGGAAAPNAGPSLPLGPIAIDQTGADNPAGVSAADVQKLSAGGPAGSFKLLYPYEGTVFPRGLLAPLVMWSGGTA